MKDRKICNLLLVFVLLSSSISTLFAQNNLYLKLKIQGNKTILLNTIDKITFNNGSMVFNYLNASPESYTISAVSRITFDPTTAVEQVFLPQTQISIYPNPVKNNLYINGLSELSNSVTIFNLNGSVLYKSEITENSLDISNLRTGLYIIKINNQTLKFSKL